MNLFVVICGGPESGEAGFNEDTTSFPLRAAVRIQMAIQPKLSGPIQVARNLFTRALVEPTKQSLSCFRVRFHFPVLSAGLSGQLASFNRHELSERRLPNDGKTEARSGNLTARDGNVSS